MGLRIHTNITSLQTQTQMHKSAREMESTLKKLASGNRLASGGEAPADFARAEQLRAVATGYRAGQQNALSARSLTDIAEGTFNEQANLIIRLKELAMQAASETFDDQSRKLVQLEFTQLAEEVDRLAQSTRFGSHQILTGSSKTYEFQVGAGSSSKDQIKAKIGFDATASGLGIDDLSVESSDEAQSALETLDEALYTLSAGRSQFAALQTRLGSAYNHSESMAVGLTQAHADIADADIAKVTSDFYRLKVVQQYQVHALAQANKSSQVALKLLA